MKQLDCVLFSGQSNENGGGVGTAVSPYVDFQSSYSFFNNQLSSFKFGVNNNHLPLELSYVCRQISFGKRYKDLTGKPILMLKYAYSGSCLVDNGTPYVNGLWQHDANPANCNGLKHSDIWLNDFVLPAIALAEKNGYRLNIIADAWCQGEGDSILQNRAENYYDKAIELFDWRKSQLEPLGVLSPTFRPLITRIHNNFNAGTRPYLDVVRTALVDIATHYSAEWINSDAYSLFADNIHWNYSGQVQHGIDTADKIVNHYI